MEAFEIKWQAPEFKYRQKGISWFWLSMIIAVVIVGFAIYQKNFLFGLFVLIAEVLILFWGNRQPRLIEFKINEKGLLVGGQKFYPYNELKSFGVSEIDDDWAEVHWQFRSHFRSEIKILLPSEKISEFREFMQPSLQEIEHESSFFDALADFFKF